MGVACGSGIVGVVYMASDHYAVVIPVLNQRSRISCTVRGRDYFGYLTWNGGDVAVAYVDDIPRHAKFLKGEWVETSGYSAIFPAGISVGRIRAVYNSSDGLSYRLKVALSTDFGRLRDVCVINRQAACRTPASQAVAAHKTRSRSVKNKVKTHGYRYPATTTALCHPVLAQVLVLNRIQLFHCATPLLYVYFAIMSSPQLSQMGRSAVELRHGSDHRHVLQHAGRGSCFHDAHRSLQPYLLELFLPAMPKSTSVIGDDWAGQVRAACHHPVAALLPGVLHSEAFNFFNWLHWLHVHRGQHRAYHLILIDGIRKW